MRKLDLATALKFGLLFSAAPLGLLIPRRLHRRVVEGTVHLFIRTMDRPREALTRNFQQASGNRLSDSAIRRRVRAVLVNYALYLADYMTLPFRRRSSILGLLNGVQGVEHMLAARELGRGVIFVGPHVGNWELAGFLLRDFNCPVHALSIRDPHPTMDQFRSKFREREGISVIFVGAEADAGGMFEIQAALARNEAVAMLGDRLYMGRDYRARFFGKEVRFPAGPLHIAAITSAPIISFVAVRVGERYTVVLAPPITVPDLSPESLKTAGDSLVSTFEAYVRRFPDQWYNFHPVFEDVSLKDYEW